MNQRQLSTSIILSLACVAGSAYAQDELVYIAVDPCRIADTRQSSQGVVTAESSRNFRVTGSAEELASQGGTADCTNPRGSEAPAAVAAYVLAVPAESSTDRGVLSAYPAGEPAPPVGSGSTVNFAEGQVIGNTTIVTLCESGCPADGELAVLARKTDEHVVIDVQGYFYRQSGVPGYELRQENFAIANSSSLLAEAACSSGKYVLGGGGTLNNSTWVMDSSFPRSDGRAWRVRYKSTGATFSASGSVYAICATAD